MDKKEIPLIKVASTDIWKDYSLVDSGRGLKLERFGKYQFVRPEAQAVWEPSLNMSAWDKADAVFQSTGEEHGGHWIFKNKIPESWTMQYEGLRFKATAGAARHLGVFPEQAVHWDWMIAAIPRSGRACRVLNLFGYTGLATLAAARAGAEVTHVDASKKSVAWARENQELSGLTNSQIRWIVDDAQKFVEREARRGSRYDGIILDPPKFGRGPKGEVWEFFKMLPALLKECKSVLVPEPLFMILTAYAVKSSALTLYGSMRDLLTTKGGKLEVGELATVEQSAGRLVSNAIYARWSAD